MYQKFINFLSLDKDQLKLVDEYIQMKLFDFDSDEDFEFFNDL